MTNLIIIRCSWNLNGEETREFAQQHREKTIRFQIAENSEGIVCVLRNESCFYECEFQADVLKRHLDHFLDCDRLTIAAIPRTP